MKKNLTGFELSRNTSFKTIAKRAAGLSYSEIVRACEEAIKEMIIKGKSKIPVSSLMTSLEKRKQ